MNELRRLPCMYICEYLHQFNYMSIYENILGYIKHTPKLYEDIH